MANSWAYFCGKWVDGDSIQIPANDLGFVLGVTVVERLRTFGGQPFRVAEHLCRLRRSLEIVGWNAAQITDDVAATIDEFVVRNAQNMAADDDWFIVAFVTPGKTAAAENPTICVHGGPLEFDRWVDGFATGVDTVIADARQVPSTSWPPELKCRSRMHYYLADRQAAAAQAGARAIVLDANGNIGEASTANVVMFDAEQGLITPKLGGVLPGISLAVLQELAAELSIAFNDRDISPAELEAADEAFLTSTSICVQPIATIDGKQLGSECPGPMFRKLLAAWNELVGIDIAEQARRFANRD